MRHAFACCLLFVARLLAAQSDYYIKFPDDLFLLGCDYYTPPQIYNSDSAKITIDYQDEIFGITPACFTITRT